jgi:hypothetical protein
MDMSVLHRHPPPDRDYTRKDKLNSLTGHLDCRFLEWTGWYNQDIYQRLLGHYRLYQLFKKENSANVHLSLPLAYIVNYRASQGVKYLLSRIVGFLYHTGSFGKPYYPQQTEGINKLLVHENAGILQEFLEKADVDFDQALINTIQQISSPGFGRKNVVKQSAVIVQTKNEYTSYHNSHHYFNEFTTVQASANGIKGKEKGVFSKRQVLIFFDLLAEGGKMERIDFTKPNKFDSIAALMFALTGKSKESWIEQLKDYRNKGLYEFQNEGERKQLIVILTNLSEIFRAAGIRNIATRADKKLRGLDIQKFNNKER